MRKQYVWQVKIISPYGVKSIVMCKDKNKLSGEVNKPKYKDFTVGQIQRSAKHFVTDGNNELHYKTFY